MNAIEIVRTTARSGATCWQARDEHGHALAAALHVDGRWSVFAYASGPPTTPLETGDEATARGWVRWIAEQLGGA